MSKKCGLVRNVTIANFRDFGTVRVTFNNELTEGTCTVGFVF